MLQRKSEDPSENTVLSSLIELYASNNISVKIVGSLIVLMSALLLVADKLVKFIPLKIDNIRGYYSLEDYIWVLMQSIAPLLILVAVQFRPYRVSYLLPTYAYCLQLSWTLSENGSDNYLSYFYSIGICALVLIVFYTLNRALVRFTQKQRDDEAFIRESKEVLEILKNRVLEEKQ